MNGNKKKIFQIVINDNGLNVYALNGVIFQCRNSIKWYKKPIFMHSRLYIIIALTTK